MTRTPTLSFFEQIRAFWCGLVGCDWKQKRLSSDEFLHIMGVPLNDNRKVNNAEQILASLLYAGYELGLNKPHRLAMYLAQVSHESGGFRYDREVWGPSAAQARYDTRTDLGNTAAQDGDGFLYRGRTAIQITGKWNYREFTEWCRDRFGHNAPNFVIQPDKVNEDPWEGMGPIWYWQTRSLNELADRGEFKAITRAINGGYNGHADRQQRYDRISLKMLGYPDTVNGRQKFQFENDLSPDGQIGPITRSALFRRLKELPAYKFPATV